MDVVLSLIVHAFSPGNSGKGQYAIGALGHAVNHGRLILYPHSRVVQHNKVARLEPAKGPVKFKGVLYTFILVLPAELFG